VLQEQLGQYVAKNAIRFVIPVQAHRTVAREMGIGFGRLDSDLKRCFKPPSVEFLLLD